MNINDDYQKRREKITSFPAEAIIEPNKKYLESNSFYPLSNLIYREYLGDTGKLIEGMNLHKKRPFNRVFKGFTKSSVSLFPLFQ